MLEYVCEKRGKVVTWSNTLALLVATIRWRGLSDVEDSRRGNLGASSTSSMAKIDSSRSDVAGMDGIGERLQASLKGCSLICGWHEDVDLGGLTNGCKGGYLGTVGL